MILRELFYFNSDTAESEQDDSYEPTHDQSPLKASDTRKTRLTLGQLNRIRKASDMHKKEKEKDLEHVKQMYGGTGEEELL
jgi:hypothetical protein